MKTYGLIGYPLSHSYSQKYFTEKFQKENIQARFLNFPISSINQLQSVIENNPALEGLSITIPYKTEVIKHLNELDETAGTVGAVNCIRIRRTRNSTGRMVTTLKGYNTDVYGFHQSIKPFLESHHSKALILGTGGASKAIAYVLKRMGIETHKVSRRNEPGQNGQFTYAELNQHIMRSFPLIVNTSPAGTFPETDTFPAIPYQYLTNKHFLYDLVYNPEETIFLKNGKQKGAFTMNGIAMLQLQAEKAWEIFCGQ
jgi:shikimate dehydrogenase